MITATFLAVLFVPVFYVVVQGWSERRAARRLGVARPARASVAD